MTAFEIPVPLSEGRADFIIRLMKSATNGSVKRFGEPMHLIEHTFMPSRLLLVWQAPDGQDRTRYAVGELREHKGQISFRYLPQSEDFQKARSLGFSGYPAFRFRKANETFCHGVREAFLRRVPPRSRGDFPRFLEQWRLEPEAELSDLALLAYCGAKLPSDGFSLVWPLEEVQAPGEVMLEVAGFRYQAVDLDDLEVGMPVHFATEPANPSDPRALRVEAGGHRIGYVNRFQRDTVATWLQQYRVEAWVERFIGTAERPLVYIFCRISPATENGLPRAAVS